MEISETWEKVKYTYKSLPSLHKKLVYITVFLLAFLILSVPFYIFYESDTISLLEVEKIQANQVSWFLNAFGLESVVLMKGEESDPIIYSVNGDFLSISLSKPCTGYRSMWAFGALVLALPLIAWRKRLYGFFIGLAILWVLNLVRLLSTLYATHVFGFDVFEVVHTFLWREGLIFITFGLWVAWIKFYVGELRYEFKV